MKAHLIPTDRHYSSGHSWLALAPGGRFADYPLRVGVTDIALANAGDILRIELPPVSDTIRAGAPCARLWMSSHPVLTVRSPISGRVTITNPHVVDDPQLIADDPFYKGWLFAILPSPASSGEGLLTPAQYAHKLREG
ncbi:glycine cleavage system protein H [Hoyosella altamirensis]|uniref:Glycine cleavage system H protein n=1 Tax=Hoyosella altamirensis TaxID=616997 RepID=A0A839RTQ2_9ACTN|nr:glycine cleavage system protein H [Hoyosella altamirensis]MBB3039191.1 glycine cleavage system H protein [Hoyosella altamirensis]